MGVGPALTAARNLLPQPRLGESPVAHDRAGRDAEDFRRLLDAQPAEEPKLDELAFARGKLGQARERVVERDHLCGALVGDDQRLVERDFESVAAALLVAATARVVNQDAAHRLGCDGEEVYAILPLYLLVAGETQVGLVHQG